MTAGPLTIVSLTAENIKRLRAVHITPDGATVVIAGRNAQGKSSVLDSIWLALGGAAAQKATRTPVRHGETAAHVTLDLGELVVKRTWNGQKSTLTVTSADGARYSSPQAMLDGLIGKLSFDPLAFAQQPDREQRDTLLGLVQLPFNLEELDSRRRQVFEERTGTNRAVKEADAQLAGMPRPRPGLPDVELSAAELLARIRAAQAAHDQADRVRREQQSAQDAVDDLAARLKDALARLTTAKDAVAQLPAELPDPAVMEAQLEDLEQTNTAVRAARARADVDDRRARVAATATAQTAELAGIDRTRADALAQARMPIDGLGLDDTGVTYRGVPLKQASSAEQLRVSVAMAMALNPAIRVIRITDGSLLDSGNLQLIEQMAAQHGFQVWIERVDETGAVGVVIEDGMCVSPQPPDRALTGVPA